VFQQPQDGSPGQEGSPNRQSSANQHDSNPSPDSNNQPPTSQASQPFLHQMMASGQRNDEFVMNGHRYRRVGTHRLHYKVQNGERRAGSRGSLVDGGANGGFAGSDVLVLEESNRFADVSGIANHTVENIPICTVAGKIITTRGPAIGIFHQYAYFGEGSTIHSPHQLAHFGLKVDDQSVKVGGHQRIVTLMESLFP